MASIFTKIINGELPCYKIHEDELTISILTIEPIHLGHTLVIPKEETNHWFEVSDKALAQVQLNAKKIAPAIMKATNCQRVGTIAAGFEVPHYHLHLVPAWKIADLDFKLAKKRSEQEQLEIQKKIIAAL